MINGISMIKQHEVPEQIPSRQQSLVLVRHQPAWDWRASPTHKQSRRNKSSLADDPVTKARALMEVQRLRAEQLGVPPTCALSRFGVQEQSREKNRLGAVWTHVCVSMKWTAPLPVGKAAKEMWENPLFTPSLPRLSAVFKLQGVCLL